MFTRKLKERIYLELRDYGKKCFFMSFFLRCDQHITDGRPPLLIISNSNTTKKHEVKTYAPIQHKVRAH